MEVVLLIVLAFCAIGLVGIVDGRLRHGKEYWKHGSLGCAEREILRQQRFSWENIYETNINKRSYEHA